MVVCPREDLNLQPLRDTLLKRTRMPVPPRGPFDFAQGKLYFQARFVLMYQSVIPANRCEGSAIKLVSTPLIKEGSAYR